MSYTPYPMKLISGTAVSRKRRWMYRGHTIVQTYRTHDVRNKTHRGYEWHVEFNDGTFEHPVGGTRLRAKAAIDHRMDAGNNQSLNQ